MKKLVTLFSCICLTLLLTVSASAATGTFAYGEGQEEDAIVMNTVTWNELDYLDSCVVNDDKDINEAYAMFGMTQDVVVSEFGNLEIRAINLKGNESQTYLAISSKDGSTFRSPEGKQVTSFERHCAIFGGMNEVPIYGIMPGEYTVAMYVRTDKAAYEKDVANGNLDEYEAKVGMNFTSRVVEQTIKFCGGSDGRGTVSTDNLTMELGTDFYLYPEFYAPDVPVLEIPEVVVTCSDTEIAEVSYKNTENRSLPGTVTVHALKTGTVTITITSLAGTRTREAKAEITLTITEPGSLDGELQKAGGNYYQISDVEDKTVIFSQPVKEKISSVVIPATVTIDGTKYKVTAIAKNAFRQNKYIKNVKIGKNVKTIGDYAFYKCTGLKSVTLGSNVTSIGKSAFASCKLLTKITIPAKVSKIGTKAFYNCSKLKSITIKTKKLTTKKVGSKAFGNIYSKAKISVPSSKLKSYKSMLKKRGISSKATVKKIK